MVITPQIFGLETKCLALYPGFDAQMQYGNTENPVIAYSQRERIAFGMDFIDEGDS